MKERKLIVLTLQRNHMNEPKLNFKCVLQFFFKSGKPKTKTKQKKKEIKRNKQESNFNTLTDT